MTEEEREKIAEGEADEDVYEEEGREELEEDAEISAEEEGFMKGYEEDGKMAMCAKCGKIFKKDFVEKEIDGEVYRFCSGHCAEAFKKK
jgi:hypothetical protein